MILHFSFGYGQRTECDVTQDILKKIFTKYEIKQIEDQQVFETTVWDKHASIPLTKCHVVDLYAGIKAVTFNIYLSEDPNDYQNMLKESITMELDIDESSLYQGHGERLIQVIFYDTVKDKFLGKPENFPIAELSWVDQGYTSPLRTDIIKTFKKVEDCKNTILLTIEEYDGYSQGLHYFFKYHDDKIMTASIRTCIEKIYEQKNRLFVKHTDNCLDVEYEDADEEIVFRIILEWQ